jgi:hypothetical protein
MAHFAKIENGIVVDVIVAEQDFINSGAVGDPSEWVQTSYNTRENSHLLGGTPLRGNYAGIGGIYDAENDVFYSQSPYASWVLNTELWLWVPPIPYPGGSEGDGKAYTWNEETVSWDNYMPTISTPYPDDGKAYTWNEETMSWDEVPPI